MSVVNLLAPDSGAYQRAAPFAHVRLQGLWDADFLGTVADEVAAQRDWDGEKQFEGARFKRWCSTWNKLPPAVSALIHEASQPAMLRWLEQLTGEASLVPDPYLEGAGIHAIGTGGFLKMHADFNWHQPLHLYRRLNMLIYLNRDWDEAWGGDLRLAAQGQGGVLDVRETIFPHFNTTVIFTTDDDSFHGHPDPLRCPDDVQRASIALYYYSAIRPAKGHRRKRLGTDYRALEGGKLTPGWRDRMKRALGVR